MVDGYGYRKRAKVFAWLNLVGTLFQLVLLVMIFALLKGVGERNPASKVALGWLINDEGPKFDGDASVPIHWKLSIFLAVNLICNMVQLSAAIVLIVATDIYRHPREALSLTMFFCWVTMVVLILEYVIFLNSSRFTDLAFIFQLVPLATLFILDPFVVELEDRIKSILLEETGQPRSNSVDAV